MVRFSEDDLALFGKASHDRNPLHLDPSYARKTPYGAQVVFGAVGALACLAHIPNRRGSRVSELHVTFERPLYLGEDYRVASSSKRPDHAEASLYDGLQRLLSMRVTFTEGAEPAAVPEPSAQASRAQAALRSTAELKAGESVQGKWAPDRASLALLLTRFGVAPEWIDSAAVTGLLWMSYVVGMELPGQQALFSSGTVRLVGGPAIGGDGFAYAATVARVDPRFNMSLIRGRLFVGGDTFAEAEMRAFVREDLRPDFREEADLEGLGLEGKVALVVGASRGLGASIARALVWQGCTVLATFAQSVSDAQAVANAVRHAPGRLQLVRGDAADPAWCADLADRVSREFGGLDLLVCSAAPVPRPTVFEPATVERIAEYVSTSLALVSVPLSALLDHVATRRGVATIVSSAYVASPPREWPQYVAAKSAIEGLVQVVAMQQPNVRFIVVRPPRLLTDMANSASPLERAGAIPPAHISRALLRALAGRGGSRSVGPEILDEFADNRRGAT